jgi:hypothetical protein
MTKLLDWLRQVGRWIRPAYVPLPRRPIFTPGGGA